MSSLSLPDLATTSVAGIVGDLKGFWCDFQEFQGWPSWIHLSGVCKDPKTDKEQRSQILQIPFSVKEALYAACVTMSLGESAKLLTNEHFVEEKEAVLHDVQILLAAWFRFNVLPVDRKMTIGEAEAAGSAEEGSTSEKAA